MKIDNAWIYRVECDDEKDDLILDFRIKVPLNDLDNWKPIILTEKDVEIEITDERLI